MTDLQIGIYFQQVKKFSTPEVELVDGTHSRIPNGGNVIIGTHGIDAVIYTLDRKFVPTWHTKPVVIAQPWRRPNNVVFVAELVGKDKVKLTTISAIEQSGKFWLVCEEKLVSIFMDSVGLWSPQLWGKTAEVQLLLNLEIEPIKSDRVNFAHVPLEIGQVAFYNVAAGTGAICVDRDPEGNSILARAYWRDVTSRDSLGGMKALVAGEIVKVNQVVELDDPETSFKFDAKGIGIEI